MEIIGYNLVEVQSGNVIQGWGGIPGQCPGIPNPIHLPEGTLIYGPNVDVEYNGYKLIPIYSGSDPVPASLTPRQIRLFLLSQGLLDNVESLVKQSDRATQITWEWATEFRRDNPILLALAAQLGLTDDKQIDDMFIAAAKL